MNKEVLAQTLKEWIGNQKEPPTFKSICNHFDHIMGSDIYDAMCLLQDNGELESIKFPAKYRVRA